MTKFRSISLLEKLIKPDFSSVLLTFEGSVKLRSDVLVTLRSFFIVSLSFFRNTNLTFSVPWNAQSEPRGTEKGEEQEQVE